MFIFGKLKEYIICYHYRSNGYCKYTDRVFINRIQNGINNRRSLNNCIVLYDAGIRYSYEWVYSKAFGNLFNNGQWIEFIIGCGHTRKQFLLNTDMKVCQCFIPSKNDYSNLTYKKFLNGNNLWKIYRRVRLHDENLEYAIQNIIFNGRFRKCTVDIYDFITYGRFTLKYDKDLLLYKIKRMVCCQKDLYEHGVFIKTCTYSILQQYIRN